MDYREKEERKSDEENDNFHFPSSRKEKLTKRTIENKEKEREIQKWREKRRKERKKEGEGK